LSTIQQNIKLSTVAIMIVTDYQSH